MTEPANGRSLLLGGASAAVRLELQRCQRNIDRGGSASFWLWRLRPVLAQLETMAGLVRQRIELLERLDRERAVQAELERGAREASVTLKAGEDQ